MDSAIVACRYVSNELMKKLQDDIKAHSGETLPFPPVYPGSIKRPCGPCGEAVWVGPRQQEVVQAGNVLVACLRCAVLVAGASSADEITIGQLGNPYQPARNGT